MNRRAIIQAAYYTCRAWGRETTARNVAAEIQRASGVDRGFRWSEIDAWLYENDAAYRARATKRQRRGNTSATKIEHETPPAGNVEGNLHAGDSTVLLEDRRGRDATETPSPPHPLSNGKQPRLPLVDPVKVRSSSILAMLWQRVQPVVSRSMTRKAWTERNRRAADGLTARTDDEILDAHDRASARFGSTVYSVVKIADELLRDDAAPPDPGDGLPSVLDVPIHPDFLDADREPALAWSS